MRRPHSPGMQEPGTLTFINRQSVEKLDTAANTEVGHINATVFQAVIPNISPVGGQL